MNWIAKTTLLAVSVAAMGLAASPTPGQGVPVFKINHADSSIKFNVKASVPIAGTFDKWDASVIFSSPD
jgi:hypothetical protein